MEKNNKPEFNPRRFLLLFVTLSLSSLFLFFTSLLAADTYNKFFENETFDVGVRVASISIENLTYEQAAKTLKEKTAQWKQKNPVILVYNNQKVTVNPDAWVYDIEESVEKASATSGSGKMQVDLNADLVDDALNQFKDKGLDQVLDREMLFVHLKQIGEALPSETKEVQLGEFLTILGNPDEVVSESSVELVGELPLLGNWVEGLNGYEIEPFSAFSLLEAIEEQGMTAQDSIDINVLASAIHGAVQKTNFVYTERHISRELPDYADLGYEAYVKPKGDDLAFQNPNPLPYKLELMMNDGKLTVSVVGIPFPFSYKVEVVKQEFEPKTIIHFNKNLHSFLSSVLVDSGKKGYLASVYRVSYGERGEIVEKLKLFEDFYPPKHRIEERGYPKEQEDTLPEDIPGDIPIDGMIPPYPYPWYPYPQNPDNPDDLSAPVLPGIPGDSDASQSEEENGQTSAPQGGVAP
jgi:hypothetical protein